MKTSTIPLLLIIIAASGYMTPRSSADEDLTGRPIAIGGLMGLQDLVGVRIANKNTTTAVLSMRVNGHSVKVEVEPQHRVSFASPNAQGKSAQSVYPLKDGGKVDCNVAGVINFALQKGGFGTARVWPEVIDPDHSSDLEAEQSFLITLSRPDTKLKVEVLSWTEKK